MGGSRPVVAVVCGGPSAEAEVSRSSGGRVAAALRERYANVELVELDGALPERLGEIGPDVVFPVLHGPPGEDGTFQGFLEIAGYPYVGSGVHASACAMDKVVAKRLFAEARLPVAPDVVCDRDERDASTAGRVFGRLGAEVVVKPARQGSAVGVLFARGDEELEAALSEAFRYDRQVVVERRIRGREITVGVLERDGLEVLPAIEVRTPTGSWYDYEHRYGEGMSEHVIPAPLAPPVYDRILQIGRDAHRALGCRDLSRADLIVPEDGEPVLLEVNTMPGLTPTSLFPDAARAAGIPFPELVAGLVERARARGPR